MILGHIPQKPSGVHHLSLSDVLVAYPWVSWVPLGGTSRWISITKCATSHCWWLVSGTFARHFLLSTYRLISAWLLDQSTHQSRSILTIEIIITPSFAGILSNCTTAFPWGYGRLFGLKGKYSTDTRLCLSPADQTLRMAIQRLIASDQIGSSTTDWFLLLAGLETDFNWQSSPINHRTSLLAQPSIEFVIVIVINQLQTFSLIDKTSSGQKEWFFVD